MDDDDDDDDDDVKVMLYICFPYNKHTIYISFIYLIFNVIKTVLNNRLL